MTPAATNSRHRKTALAKSDYADILRYTLKRWGRGQFSVYRQLLNDCIIAVAREPERLNSHARDELQAGVRSFHIGLLGAGSRSGPHIVYYRQAGDGIVEILRILHDRMEISGRVP